MAIRLSNRQMTERDRVLAWLNDQPFSTSARSKPAVPVLTPAEVREKYFPINAQDTGQFFTPDAMASRFINAIEATGLALDSVVLEPSAGLGALLTPLEGKGLAVKAFELDQDCARIGERLVPWVSWTNANVFDHMTDIEGKFDWVLANPPFGIKWGTYSAEEVCTGGATRSEHMFLELALRSLKAGGHAAFIAPQTFLTTGPKKFRQWFQEHAATIYDDERGVPLSGEFALTKINVCLFLFERLDVDIPVVAEEPVPTVEEFTARLEEQVASAAIPSDTGRPGETKISHPTAIVLKEALVNALALIKPMTNKASDLAFRIAPEGIELVASGVPGDVLVKVPAQVTNAPTSDLIPLVPAQTLADLAKVMDSGPITITEANGQLHLTGGNSTSHVTLRSGSCSTQIYERIVGKDPAVTITGQQLADLSRVTPASADDEARLDLTAVSLSITGDQLMAACADGFILALRSMTVPASKDCRALVGADSLAAVLRAAKVEKADVVELRFQSNGLALHIPSLNVYYHLWEKASKFPDFAPLLKQYVPAKGPAIKMTVKTWQKFLRRSRSILAERGHLVLATIGCQLYAAAEADDLGVTEDMLGEYDGLTQGWTVLAPNIAKTMLDILAAETDDVIFAFGETNVTPPVITSGSLTVIAMPLNVPPNALPELVKRQQSGAIPLFIPAVSVEAEAEAVPA